MRNMFGEPKKRQSIETTTQKHILFLEKQLKNLEIQLKNMHQEYITATEHIKNTESQKQEEALKIEETQQIEENETIFHEEEETVSHETDYILLEKPIPPRQKAIDILEKEAVKKVNTNRREIIKEKIEEELKKQELSAKELKILFVDEYGYCSKATFYRYLETLRKEGRIDSIKINGKEYLCSIPTKNSF